MKKMFLLLVLLIFSMIYLNESYATVLDDTVPEYCYDPVRDYSINNYSLCPVVDFNPSEDYTSLADRSEYTRIEKIEGIWYGVIDVTDVKVESAFSISRTYYNVISVSFSRDLKDLKQIELDIVTVDNSCTGWPTPLFCIGDRADSYKDTITINNTSNSDNFFSFIDGDYIHANDKYDYVLFYEGPEIATVTIVKFTYILTDQEIIDLRLDIQEQYELEKLIIIENPLLSDNDKLLQIIALVEEYKHYEVDFDEEFTSICIGDICTAYNENTSDNLPDDPFSDMPDWAREAFTSLLKGVGVIIGAVASVSFVGIIAYMFVKKGLDTTGSVAIGGTKLTIRSSMWWGSMFGTGILVFLQTIWNGFVSFLQLISNGVFSIFTSK